MQPFKRWISAERGRQAHLARALGVGPNLVQYWRAVGRIPAHHLGAVSTVTGIPVDQLLPPRRARRRA